MIPEERPPTEATPADLTSGDKPRGWDGLSQFIGGLRPDDVPELVQAKVLEAVYPLLHGLLGRTPEDFLIRAATLKTLVAAGMPSFSAKNIDEVLYWLDDHARDSTIRALRANGWLDYSPSVGTTITDAGRWTFEVLGFLQKRLQQSELRPTVAGLEYALSIGMDPVGHLESLRSRLNALRQEMASARASYSEVILRKAASNVEAANNLSQHIRTVLAHVPLDNRGARRLVKEIHDLLSYLHQDSSSLHADITEVGRQLLRLTAGMTVEQIVKALMRKSRQELTSAGREALLPVLIPPPLLNTKVLASAAEQQFLRERPPAEDPPTWEIPAAPPTTSEADLVPPEVVRFLADLGAIVQTGSPSLLKDLIPRQSTGESFLRASLLPLVGDHRAGEGVAGRLGSLLLCIRVEGDGALESLDGTLLKELTPGSVYAINTDSKESGESVLNVEDARNG